MPILRRKLHIAITGASGFIGKNLYFYLKDHTGLDVEFSLFDRSMSFSTFYDCLDNVDWVVHLAGENRPAETNDFWVANADLTSRLCEALEDYWRRSGRQIPLILSSSIQAGKDHHYGQSKLAAEQHCKKLVEETGIPVAVFRLPGVFGKWCRPNYNSVVATFCHNLARGIEIQVDADSKGIDLVYIDDVCKTFADLMARADLEGFNYVSVNPIYKTTPFELADYINDFSNSYESLLPGEVGDGFKRALYATFVSYLPPERFASQLEFHSDSRGDFAEMLKTPTCGQFSYFTSRPGVTRGGHYHHTKVERFVVVKGQANFRFRCLQSNQLVERLVCGGEGVVVESIPGWTHDVVNIGTDELIVMLWANEVFDRSAPDTFQSKV